MKKNNKKKGQNFENKVQKTLNSGALWFSPADLRSDEHVIEVKFTEQKGFRITTRMLEKLWNEALDANKLPLLVIGIEEDKQRWMLRVQIEKEIK